MPCYRPLPAARATGSNLKPLVYSQGRRPEVLAKGFEKLELPCGQCIGCRLERSRQWAVRIMHEAQLHDDSLFITLTYDDEHRPVDGCVNVEHTQKFLKRLRRARPKQRIRFFLCGEYGETYDRPHYHACIFGTAFPDRKKWMREAGHDYYVSEELNRIWGKGFAIIGALTFESAAYVARYVTKKITGPAAEEHYVRDDALTGNVRRLTPEFATMSRRPGLAKDWFDEYASDVYPFDEVISRGHPTKPPRYYDQLLERSDPQQYLEIKLQREEAAAAHAANNTPARLAVRETVTKARLNQQTRGYEK